MGLWTSLIWVRNVTDAQIESETFSKVNQSLVMHKHAFRMRWIRINSMWNVIFVRHVIHMDQSNWLTVGWKLPYIEKWCLARTFLPLKCGAVVWLFAEICSICASNSSISSPHFCYLRLLSSFTNYKSTIFNNHLPNVIHIDKLHENTINPSLFLT